MTDGAHLLHNPFWTQTFPDPFVLKTQGRYYAYATADAAQPARNSPIFPILTSTDLVHWEQVGYAMAAQGEPFFHYWAPEVTEYNGKFLMYYAVHSAPFIGGIRVAIADHPSGPFVDSGVDLTGHLTPWAIDAHVLRTSDGPWYLFMTVEYWQEAPARTGSGNVVVRMRDPFTVEGPLTRVTPPDHAWQLFEAKREERQGLDWYTVEGPTVIRHRGRYYQMFSGGCYYRDNYAVSFATADRPMGTGGMQDTTWRDWEDDHGETFLLRGDGKDFISPGHNSLVYGPNNVDLYTAFHVQPSGAPGRQPCLERVYWHGERPWIPAPRAIPAQPRPPRWQERGTGSQLAPTWKTESGTWKLFEGSLQQDDAHNSKALLGQQEVLGDHWVLEINARLLEGTEGTGEGTRSYGVVFTRAGQEVWTVSLTTTGKLLVEFGQDGQHVSCEHNLPGVVNLLANHQLLISYSGSVLRVQFDGLSVYQGKLPGPVDHFALSARQCRAAFCALALTDHFHDDFSNKNGTLAEYGWRSALDAHNATSSWFIQNGALVQDHAGQEVRSVRKGSQLAAFEYGASLRLSGEVGEHERSAGLALYAGEESGYSVELRSGQDEAVLVLKVGGGEEEQVLQVLPADFAWEDWHALRLSWSDGELGIALDGPEIATVSLKRQALSPGLLTRNTRAEFTEVWQTGWVIGS